jgi:hypothetical protein
MIMKIIWKEINREKSKNSYSVAYRLGLSIDVKVTILRPLWYILPSPDMEPKYEKKNELQIEIEMKNSKPNH